MIYNGCYNAEFIKIYNTVTTSFATFALDAVCRFNK